MRVYKENSSEIREKREGKHGRRTPDFQGFSVASRTGKVEWKREREKKRATLEVQRERKRRMSRGESSRKTWRMDGNGNGRRCSGTTEWIRTYYPRALTEFALFRVLRSFYGKHQKCLFFRGESWNSEVSQWISLWLSSSDSSSEHKSLQKQRNIQVLRLRTLYSNLKMIVCDFSEVRGIEAILCEYLVLRLCRKKTSGKFEIAPNFRKLRKYVQSAKSSQVFDFGSACENSMWIWKIEKRKSTLPRGKSNLIRKNRRTSSIRKSTKVFPSSRFASLLPLRLKWNLQRKKKKKRESRPQDALFHFPRDGSGALWEWSRREVRRPEELGQLLAQRKSFVLLPSPLSCVL